MSKSSDKKDSKCASSDDVSPIKTSNVWEEKALTELGVSPGIFRFTQESPEMRYLELLTKLGGVEKGSEGFEDAIILLDRANAKNDQDLVNYFLMPAIKSAIRKDHEVINRIFSNYQAADKLQIDDLGLILKLTFNSKPEYLMSVYHKIKKALYDKYSKYPKWIRGDLRDTQLLETFFIDFPDLVPEKVREHSRKSPEVHDLSSYFAFLRNYDPYPERLFEDSQDIDFIS